MANNSTAQGSETTPARFEAARAWCDYADRLVDPASRPTCSCGACCSRRALDRPLGERRSVGPAGTIFGDTNPLDDRSGGAEPAERI